MLVARHDDDDEGFFVIYLLSGLNRHSHDGFAYKNFYQMSFAPCVLLDKLNKGFNSKFHEGS